MSTPQSTAEYLGLFATELGERILQNYPPLHRIEDGHSSLIHNLLRKPFPAQRLAIMGLVKRWEMARAAAVIAECGTGKTLISLGCRIRSKRGGGAGSCFLMASSSADAVMGDMPGRSFAYTRSSEMESRLVGSQSPGAPCRRSPFTPCANDIEMPTGGGMTPTIV